MAIDALLYLSLHVDAQDPASIAEADESHAASVLAVDDGDDEIPDRHRPHPFAGLTRVIHNLEVLAGRFHRPQIHEHLVLREGVQ